MPASQPSLSIGDFAVRSGVAPSALRFYESKGLLRPERSAGGQRRYPRAELRRMAFIRAAQEVGIGLREIREALDELPESRTPNRADWARLSRHWQGRLDERISRLVKLRDDLAGCIGCGCLSLQLCRLYNRDDEAAAEGSGARGLRPG